MTHLDRLRRLLYITRVFVRHDLDEFVLALHLFRPYRFVLRLLPSRWRRRPIKPRAVRLREALEELGPIFVKFGQMLSTRPDLLPEDIARELSRLQDRVPPFPGEQAVAIVEHALGGPLAEFFVEFDRTPVASASIAQVHFAKLLDGTEVAVKVLRPGIDAVIERDLALLYTLARFALRYSPDARRLRPLEVVDEYSKVIHDELDLMREGANASQLRANFEGSDLLYVPQVYWDYTRTTVLVMERISGIPISQIDALRAAGVDMRRLAHNGVEIFFTQAFRDGFFHADMHPGNIFVSPDGQYRAVDFGIMGTLSDVDKRYLAENFVAFFNRDYQGVARAHIHAGWVPEGTRAEEFEAAIRAVCEPIFAKPIKDISFGRLLLRLFQTARRFDMQIQPQLVLLQKTLFNIEGLGRRLYPELDLWVTAKPFLERWMREQFGPRAAWRALRREAPRWASLLPDLPDLLHAALQQRGQAGSVEDQRALIRARAELERRYRRLLVGMGVSALALAGVLGLVTHTQLASAFPLISGVLVGIGAALLILGWQRRTV